jgi:hypothetical protein
MAIIQRFRTVRTAGLVAAVTIASVCTSSEQASASPGCDRLNGSYYASDVPGVKNVNNGHVAGAVFTAGDRITAEGTPSSYVTVGLADYATSDPDAATTPLGFLVPLTGSFTYTVPAATNHTLRVIFGFGGVPTTVSWSCSNQADPRK